jgi:hypothetical protein
MARTEAIWLLRPSQRFGLSRLKVRHAVADARLHAARKTKAPDDWDPPSEPYDPYVRAA